MRSHGVLVPCKRGRSSSSSFIPDHICDLILGKLKAFSQEYFRFGCVCKQWFSILMQDRLRRRHLHHSNQLVPLMVLPIRYHQSASAKFVHNSLFSVIDKKTLAGLNLRLTYDAADDDIINYCGSSYGWLSYCRSSFEIVLYNPFAAAVDNVIRLPPIMCAIPYSPCPQTDDKCLIRYWLDFHSTPRNLGFQYAVKKIALSADPRTAPAFLVAAIYSGCERLAFFSYRANSASTSTFPSWTYYGLDDKSCQFSDVIFHHDLVYACDRRCVHVIKVNNKEDCVPLSFKVCAKIDNPITVGPSIDRYVSYLTVTTSTKELLLIGKLLRLKPVNSLSLVTFQVFKLNKHHQGELRWVNMSSLDGDAVFVGFNHTVSVVASASTGCLPDSIYFTDDCPYISRDLGPYGSNGPCNIGVFNLIDIKECKRYSRVPTVEQLPMPPIWILPML